MAGVFLSYSRKDRLLAERVVMRLREIGVDVWWDQEMLGVNWHKDLETHIHELAAVIVLWTETSFESENVRDEARLARNTHKLVNVICGVEQPPFPFDSDTGLPLDGWSAQEGHAGWERLVKTIEHHLASSGSIDAGTLMAAVALRDSQLRGKREAVRLAEVASLQAESDVNAHVAKGKKAEAALEARKAQLRTAIEMNFSSSVVRAAQLDVEQAQNEVEQAEASLASARAVIIATSQRLADARAELTVALDPPASAGRPDGGHIFPPVPDSLRAGSIQSKETAPEKPEARPLSGTHPGLELSERSEPRTGGAAKWRPMFTAAVVGLCGLALVIGLGLYFSGYRSSAPAPATNEPSSTNDAQAGSSGAATDTAEYFLKNIYSKLGHNDDNKGVYDQNLFSLIDTSRRNRPSGDKGPMGDKDPLCFCVNPTPKFYRGMSMGALAGPKASATLTIQDPSTVGSFPIRLQVDMVNENGKWRIDITPLPGIDIKTLYKNYIAGLQSVQSAALDAASRLKGKWYADTTCTGASISVDAAGGSIDVKDGVGSTSSYVIMTQDQDGSILSTLGKEKTRFKLNNDGTLSIAPQHGSAKTLTKCPPQPASL